MITSRSQLREMIHDRLPSKILKNKKCFKRTVKKGKHDLFAFLKEENKTIIYMIQKAIRYDSN